MTEPKAVGEFVRRFAADRDELVAARWWHEAMSEEAVGSGAPGQRGVRFPPLTEDTRRSILLILGGTAAGAFVLWGVSKGVDYGGDDDDVVTLDALEAQRRSGWDVGAAGTRLPYDGVSDVDAAGHADWLAALESFPSALAPTQARLLPYYVPTLFQVVTAPDFRRGFGPIHTSSMDRAQAEGGRSPICSRGSGRSATPRCSSTRTGPTRWRPSCRSRSGSSPSSCSTTGPTPGGWSPATR